MSLSKIKIRSVEENDIPILYDMLKEFREIPYACIHERPLPPYDDSKKYVSKFLYDNDNHELDKWYVVIDSENKVLGSVNLSKKNYISYQILIPFQGNGFGKKSVELLIEQNPRDRYFIAVHNNNEISQNLSKTLGFTLKALILEKSQD